MLVSHPRLLTVPICLEVVHAIVPVIVVAVHAAQRCLCCVFAWTEHQYTTRLLRKEESVQGNALCVLGVWLSGLSLPWMRTNVLRWHAGRTYGKNIFIIRRLHIILWRIRRRRSRHDDYCNLKVQKPQSGVNNLIPTSAMSNTINIIFRSCISECISYIS